MEKRKTTKSSGFTLAELLIVVAIIGVLVAIAIPVFRKSLEKSREAYDIYTMRQAASAAIDLYYAGIEDKQSAEAAGLLWNPADEDGTNASGVYDPSSGRFLSLKSTQGTPYGKGTKVDGGTEYTMGNDNGSYKGSLNYTNAVVMVSIYPKGDHKHVDIYWKYAKSGNGNSAGQYVGGQTRANDPRYSIRIPLS